MNSRDFEEFLSELNRAEVRYLIIGGYALAVHARPRATQDLDILFERTVGNATKLIQAISDFFGGMDVGHTPEDLVRTDTILQIGRSDFVRAKRASGRPQDLADLEALEANSP